MLYHLGNLPEATQVLEGARFSNECRIHSLLAKLFLLRDKRDQADEELHSLDHCDSSVMAVSR